MLKVPENLRFDVNGLIPAIAQDAGDGQVLLLAYMNAEALARTLEGVNWVRMAPDIEPPRQVSAVAAPDDPRLASLSWLDDLPLADRLSIFA